MSLAVGSRIGPYEITGTLGAGGMGEVYRAHDARLARDVALKVLPDAFASDPERLARFQREAQVLASLKHPNIGGIYGLEDNAGIRALVLELVEGETLADRIARGPIPVEDVLPIARQIAEALEAAHEQGVVHRDLKPSNIKVSPDGAVKVLDFGLAKLTQPSTGSHASDQTASPTITASMMTGVGTILGTAAYMAPEQAKGRPADKRSDVWAFGCVLYEMLTGRRAFEGEDISDTLAAVLRAEPDWAALPHGLPLSVRALLEGCLTKDRRQRIGDISAALFVINHQPRLAEGTEAPLVPPSVLRRAFWRRALPYAAAVIVAAAGAAYTTWKLKPSSARPVTRFSIPLPEGEAFSPIPGRHLVALSPDGTRLAYAANSRLYLRELDQLDGAPIRGTEGVGIGSPQNPFFSFDGQWVGFWAEGQLKKVSIIGGAPVTLCAAQNLFGASWGPDDTIVFDQGAAGIWRVSGSGGSPENIVKLDAGQRAQGPQMLPDGRTLLFTLATGAVRWDQAQVVVQSLDTGERTTLIDGGTDARYLVTGHIVYALQGTLLAVPFDSESHQVTGGPVPLVEDVWAATATGVAQFSVSADGALAYVPAISAEALQRTLAWVDRQGREQPITAPPRPYVYPRLSPDGTLIALDIVEENRDIWVWDLARRTLTRLTFDPTPDRAPVWTADGRRIIFSSDRSGPSNLYWQPANGTADAARLTESPNIQNASTVTPDGTHVVFHENTASGISLMNLALSGSRQIQPLVQNSFVNENAAISSDGRWLAYESNASGRDEIYVRPFPDVSSGQWQVSTSGGEQALWARNGRELFYRAPNGAVMGVSLEAGPAFTTGTPKQLIDGRYYLGDTGPRRAWRTYDVSPNGRDFLMIKNAEQPQQTATAQRIIVVENWFEELKRRVPAP